MNKQSGFTLIEIVMVLVLLGILSAVAVPKYFDLQEQAQAKTARATVAEMQARLNGTFAQALLNGDSCSTARKAGVDAVNAMTLPTGVTASQVSIPQKNSTDSTKPGSWDDGGMASVTITINGSSYSEGLQIAVPACTTNTFNAANPPATPK